MDNNIEQPYSAPYRRYVKSVRLVDMGQVAIKSSRLMCRDSKNLLREARANCDRTRHIIAAYRLVG